jgi:hypothetical protein
LIMFPRTFFVALLLIPAALAGPPLTTIQDVVYKADGTPFNGQLTISWNSFQAADHSAIATQMLTVKVLDGILRVKLVPNTTATPLVYYSVTYNSEGRVQFTETWAVPPSPQPVRLRDVRIAAANPPSGGGTPIQQSDVVGLVADLGARPTKGTAFAAGRVAFVNSQSQLDSVSGTPGDCVHVDGSAGPCATTPSFIDGDAPAGIVDGSSSVFTLNGTPNPAGSLAVYRNGLLQNPGVDYIASGRTIQFDPAAIPQPGDTLLTSYRVGGTPSGPPQLFPNPQILCSGSGAVISSATDTSMGTCTVPAGLLVSGNRLEIRFDLEHQGVAAGFTFELRWGGIPILRRETAAGEAFVTGRVDADLAPDDVRFGTLSWGTVLPLSATVGSAEDGYSAGLTLDFRGAVGQAGETLELRNYTVIRLP